jgi:ComF family protein
MWLQRVADVARGVGLLIYPNTCLICGVPEVESSPFRHGVCIDCRRSMTTDPNAVCPHCAATIGIHSDVSGGCVACRDRAFSFDRAIRFGLYQFALRDAILRMKAGTGEPVAELIGRLFAEHRSDALRAAGAEVVVPVPLHWRRRWNRGYNQAESIAREVAARLGIGCQANWLKRVKPASQHVQPSASARRENIRGAFRCRRGASLASRTVLLVDDVMTTGSTVGEASRVLKESGAAKVIVAILARA